MDIWCRSCLASLKGRVTDLSEDRQLEMLFQLKTFLEGLAIAGHVPKAAA